MRAFILVDDRDYFELLSYFINLLLFNETDPRLLVNRNEPKNTFKLFPFYFSLILETIHRIKLNKSNLLIVFQNLNLIQYKRKITNHSNMQQQLYNKFIGVILCNQIGSDLYPLTKDYPLGILSVGNKKLIAYQLQQLAIITQLNHIVVVYPQSMVKVKQYVQTDFLLLHKSYPHTIQFFCVEENTSEYLSIQRLVTSNICDNFEDAKGLIFAPLDLISSVKYNALLTDHLDKQADITILAKQKKQYGKDEKKPQFDIEPHVDIIMSNSNGQIYALRSIQTYEYSGFSLNSSVYQRVNRAILQKVIDTRVYIFSQNIIKILKKFYNSELAHLKADFIDTVIRNQNNVQLLQYISNEDQKPLKIVAKIAGPNEYIRRISNVKIYEALNLDSLIRGPKQKEVTLPNTYTQPIDEKLSAESRGSLIGYGCEIQTITKVTRSLVENGCKIGKNVDISNSIVMAGSIIQEGCKINGSVIGPHCLIKSGSMISSCQLAMNCTVEKGSNNSNEVMIPLQ